MFFNHFLRIRPRGIFLILEHCDDFLARYVGVGVISPFLYFPNDPINLYYKVPNFSNQVWEHLPCFSVNKD